MIELIMAGLAAMYIIEANHDRYVILNESDHRDYDRAWHKWDWIFHAVLSFILAYAFNSWLIVPLVFFTRATFFQNSLNVLRFGFSRFFYMGEGGSDGFLKKALGKYAGVIWFSFSIACIVAIYIFYKNVSHVNIYKR